MDQEVLCLFIMCFVVICSVTQVPTVVSMQIIVCFVVTVRRFVRGYLCFRSSYFSEMFVFTFKTTLCHTTEDRSGRIIVIFLYYF